MFKRSIQTPLSQENKVRTTSPLSTVDLAPKPVIHVATKTLPPSGGMMSKPLIMADKILDYVPFGSTVNNVVDIFLKSVVISHEDEQLGPYFQHLKDKKTSTCALYGVPILGNIAALVHTLHNPSQEEPMVISLPPARYPGSYSSYEEDAVIAQRHKDKELHEQQFDARRFNRGQGSQGLPNPLAYVAPGIPVPDEDNGFVTETI